MHGWGIVALGLPVRNQTLYVAYQNDVSLNVDNDHFIFLKSANSPRPILDERASS
jgi:hypothetical protein